MQEQKLVGKREFLQHTSKYMKWLEEHDAAVVITHHKTPEFMIVKIKSRRFSDLQGTVNVKVHGDIHEPVLTEYDEWLS